jgi:hypothetical protein
MENEKHPLDALKNDEISEKLEKWEMHTIGPGIWWENWKLRKMRNTHFRRWNYARKTEKVGKFKNVHCGTWNMARKLKIMENEKHPTDDLKNDEITEKREKWEMHTVRPRKWRENWKSRKMRNTQFRTWNMARKTEKGGKFRNVHCRIWNIATHLKIMKNEKHPLDDLKNDEITEKREKWEIYTVGREIWRGKLKKLENIDMSTVENGIWQERWKSWKMRNIHLTTWKMTKSLKNVKNEKCTL